LFVLFGGRIFDLLSGYAKTKIQLLLWLLNTHQFHAIEGPFFPSFEYDDVPIHCLNTRLMRPDFGNGAIHPDERRGYSGEDLYAVSDFEITHNNRSPSFQNWRIAGMAWTGKVGREEGRRCDENHAPAAGEIT